MRKVPTVYLEEGHIQAEIQVLAEYTGQAFNFETF